MDEYNETLLERLDVLERTAPTEIIERDDGIIFKNNFGAELFKIYIAGAEE